MTERTRVALLLAVAFIVYGNTFWNDFTFDDFAYVLNNPRVTDLSVRALFEPAKAEEGLRFFRPLTFATYELNWAFAGPHALTYHLFNVVLHATVSLLLYFVLRRLLEGMEGEATIAWVAALLFAVHPIHTEAVASIVGRSELLAAAFLLAAWLLHLRDKSVPSMICLALAMLSKESAVAYLPLVLAGDFARGRMKPFSRYASITAVTVAYVILFWIMHGRQFGERNVLFLNNPLLSLPVGLRIVNALRVAWKYLGLLFYPAALSCNYSFNAIPIYANWRHTAPAVLAALIVLALWIWALWTRRSAWFLAGAIYFAGVVTTSNILVPTGTIMGERLAYFPSAGFCLLVALLWTKLARHQQKLGWAVLAIVLILFTWRTILRNHDWRDNFSLFSSAVQAVPQSAKMHDALGGEYLHRGQTDVAMAELRTGLSIYPQFPEELKTSGVTEEDFRLLNVAVEHLKHGDNDDALEFLNLAIANSPRFSLAWSNRAAVHYARGEPALAREDALNALRLDPTNAQAQYLLSLLAAGAPSPANDAESHRN
jgi:tetratricopeptide (TPR) repeat protein